MANDSFRSVLDSAAERWPDAPAITGDLTFSYNELRAKICELADDLHARAVKPGDVVATVLPCDAQHVMLLYAILSLDAVACPLDPKLPEAALRARQARVAAAHVINASDHAHVPDGVRADGPGVLVFTSGSSAEPKAALLSADNLIASARASNRNTDVAPGDAWLLSLPLHHVSGLGILFRCLLGGAAVRIPTPGIPFADAVLEPDLTHLSLVSTQLRRLLDTESGARALARMKAILLGGGPMPAALIREAVERGLRIHTSYGLTEMASQVTVTRPGETLEGLLTSGYSLEPDTVMLAQDGEILVRGGRLFRGYWTQGILEPAPLRDGWFATRDLGRFDPAGRLIVIGRKDNMFICGGENIQPEEIEARLLEIDGVTDAIVVSAPDATFGRIPVAYVRMKDAVPLDENRLISALEQVLPRHKIPERFHAWPADLDAGSGIKVARAHLAKTTKGRGDNA